MVIKSVNLALTTCILAFGLATSANATVITGGNDVIARSYSDSYSNFSILDTNNPISASGDLTSWSIFTPANAGPVELLIYQKDGSNYDLVGQSSLVTPSSISGVQTFALSGLPVQAGDVVGLYFQGTGSAEFDYAGGLMGYTADNSGISNATNFAGFQNRTYSVSVSGLTAAVPEPATWAMMLLGFGMIGFAMRKRANVKTTVSYA